MQHRVGSCCFPDATGRTVSVLSLMDKTSRSAFVRVDRWHTGGALALNLAVPQCHRRPRSGNATGIHCNLWQRNLLPSPPFASWLNAPSAAALADRLCSEPQLLPAASRSLLARCRLRCYKHRRSACATCLLVHCLFRENLPCQKGLNWDIGVVRATATECSTC